MGYTFSRHLSHPKSHGGLDRDWEEGGGGGLILFKFCKCVEGVLLLLLVSTYESGSCTRFSILHSRRMQGPRTFVKLSCAL